MSTLSIIRILKLLVFFGPFTYLYAESLGMGHTEIMSLYGLFSVCTFLLDIPFGHVADRIGPKFALLIGLSIYGLTAIAVGLVPTVEMLWASQVLFAAGQSLYKGADSSLCYLILIKNEKKELFQAKEKFFMLAASLSGVVLATGGALILKIGFKELFVITGLLQLGSSLGCLFLPDLIGSESKNESFIGRLKLIGNSLKQNRQAKTLLATTILSGSSLAVLFFWLPSELNKHFGSGEITGYVLSAVALVSFGFLKILPKSKKEHTLILSLVMIGGFISDSKIGVFLGATMVSILLFDLIPFYRMYFMKYFEQAGPTTAMSFISSLASLGVVVISPFMGSILEVSGVEVFILIFGSLIIIGQILCLSIDKIKPAYQKIKISNKA